jgi:putative nucleotidyltransferase with HDIG domain
MTASVELLLRGLQSAIALRQLYPDDHPRFLEVIDELVGRAEELTATHGDIAVFALDNRVVWKETPLPGGEALTRSLFALLRKEGFHRLTIRRGLNTRDVMAFVSAMVDVARGGGANVGHLHSSPRIRLSSLDAPDPVEAGHDWEHYAVTSDEQASLVRVWDEVLAQRRLDFDSLDFMVLALARTLERDFRSMIPLACLKSHDEYTVIHIVNVALLAMALGEAVGFPSALVRELGMAALLHDIGKLRVPPEILNASGSLSAEQRAIIRRHPEDGARMLLATKGATDLAVAVAYEHHLQYDGGGYPSVPRNWQVNLASEITHVADVFDALRTNRPYRPALPRERIAAMMTEDAGTVFDPRLLDIFFDAVVPRTVAVGEDGVTVA